MSLYDIEFAHLMGLARDPAWRAYAVYRAAELEKDSSGLYQGIAAALDIEIKTRKAAAVAARETQQQQGESK